MKLVILALLLGACAQTKEESPYVWGDKLSANMFRVCAGSHCAYCKRSNMSDAAAFRSCEKDLGI
jgi:hypothetical protein